MKACISSFFSSKIRLCFSSLLFLVFVFLSSCSERSNDVVPDVNPNDDKEVIVPVYELNLRIHIMKDIIMLHPTGVCMDSWVTPNNVRETIVPEINAIWSQAKITWVIESIIEEDVVKNDSYQQAINYIVNCGRNSEGESDPARLPLLYLLMQPQYRSKTDELGKNLFHIYLFPFIGNTSQGNAMTGGFDGHCVLGTWSNKHNGGGIPEKTLLTEYHNEFVRGSLSRTASHELGHVLKLKHNECPYDCLMSGGSEGYSLTKAQIETARLEALERILKQ